MGQAAGPEVGQNVLLDPRLVAKVSVEPTGGRPNCYVQPVREPLAYRLPLADNRQPLMLVSQRGWVFGAQRLLVSCQLTTVRHR